MTRKAGQKWMKPLSSNTAHLMQKPADPKLCWRTSVCGTVFVVGTSLSVPKRGDQRCKKCETRL